MDSSPILEVNHVTKTYPKTGIVALDDVTLAVRRGEIHGVVGELGAGKTTLMKVLGGLFPAGSYQGEILFEGSPLTPRSAGDAIRRGIGVVPRPLSIFPRLSVAENIVMGGWQAEKRFFISKQSTERDAEAVMSRWGINFGDAVLASELSPTQQRLLMILRVLAAEPKLVVLDELTHGIKSPQGLSQLLLMVRRLAEHEVTCLYLARRPSDAFQLADRITVLRDGTVAGQWARANFDEVAVTQAMASQRDGEPTEYDDLNETGSGGIMGSLNSFFDRLLRPGS
jgi:putative multiple sugar transport system ATP-binding protein